MLGPHGVNGRLGGREEPSAPSAAARLLHTVVFIVCRRFSPLLSLFLLSQSVSSGLRLVFGVSRRTILEGELWEDNGMLKRC